jgi:hypothetical protein
MGHLNLVAGQTHGTSVQTIAGKVANGSIIANVEAGYDDCVTAPVEYGLDASGLLSELPEMVAGV